MAPLPDQPGLWTGPVEAPRRYQVDAAAVASAVTGGEGLVYRAHDTDRDVDVALKLLTAVSIADYGQIVERSIPFTTIAHPNLMAHVEVFIGTALTDDPAPAIVDFDVIYSVADWIDGLPLPDVAASATETRLFAYLVGIARALSTLHQHRSPEAPLGIVHRDVKPSNVRITTDDTAVLIDFGVARPLDNGDLTQGVGTYRWRAPEVLSGSGSITTAVDVWGLGALAYWSLTGQPPGLDGAATAREHLSHTPRCQELNDPVGIASHIAALLETNPNKRPTDLARWASQLQAIVAGRRRTGWKRPTAVTAAALLAIPFAALFIDDATGTGQNRTPPTTISDATTPGSAPGATGAPDGQGLVPAVGETWNVACLGGTESTIVSGAEPGELIRGTVRYADEATAAAAVNVDPVTNLTPDPNSYLTGPNGITSPLDVTGPASRQTRHIGGPHLTADATGSFVIEWHCNRALVGTPFVVRLIGGQSQAPTEIIVESSDYLTGLDVLPLSDGRTDDGSVQMAAGTTLEIDVFAQLNPPGTELVLDAGIEYTGRNFDPRMRLTSSNREVGSVQDSSRGGWIVTGLTAGSTVLEAAIEGTDHVATLRVEVIDRPAPLPLVEGNFVPGSVATYLEGVLGGSNRLIDIRPDQSQPESVELIPNWEYPPLLPTCEGVDAFAGPSWTVAEQLYPQLGELGPGYTRVTIHTFADASTAEAWSAAVRTAMEERIGFDCELTIQDDRGRFESLTKVSSAEFRARFALDGSGFVAELSVISARNVAVLVEGEADDLAIIEAPRVS